MQLKHKSLKDCFYAHGIEIIDERRKRAPNDERAMTMDSVRHRVYLAHKKAAGDIRFGWNDYLPVANEFIRKGHTHILTHLGPIRILHIGTASNQPGVFNVVSIKRDFN